MFTCCMVSSVSGSISLTHGVSVNANICRPICIRLTHVLSVGFAIRSKRYLKYLQSESKAFVVISKFTPPPPPPPPPRAAHSQEFRQNIIHHKRAVKVRIQIADDYRVEGKVV